MSASSACVVVAGAVVWAGATFSSAQGQERSSPSQMPGFSSGDSRYHVGVFPGKREDVALPFPLSMQAAEQYRMAFRFVRQEQPQRGLQTLDHLTDAVLKADVQAEAYLRVSAHPSVGALASWLKHYPHLPDAPALQVLERRLSAPHAVTPELGPIMPLDDVRASSEDGALLSWGGASRNAKLEKTIQDKASHGRDGAKEALHLIETARGMPPQYAAYLYGDVALSLLSQGDVAEAGRIGGNGFERGKKKISYPAYVAGLALWELHDFSGAYSHFSDAANAPGIDGEQQAAASFWAARVAERMEAPHTYEVWLKRAAVHAESLYGLLAAQRLGKGQHKPSSLSGRLSNIGMRGAEAILTRVDVDAVMSMAEGRHFFALLQVGEQGRAEILARSMWGEALSDPMRARSLQLVVHRAGMWALSEQMAHILQNTAPQELRETVEPLPVLKPRHGFKLNPALVYAVARMESNFNGNALSSAGAYGMMQIRPQTAGFIVATYITHDPRNPAAVPVPVDMPHRLKDVSYNLEVGQLYMQYLAASVARGEGHEAKAEQADLLRVLASYNAGPQAITRWENTQKLTSDDPLYYIETLPNGETRRYVHNVLKTAWLYAHRMGKSAPSLKSLSEGKWPSFHREETVRESPS